MENNYTLILNMTTKIDIDIMTSVTTLFLSINDCIRLSLTSKYYYQYQKNMITNSLKQFILLNFFLESNNIDIISLISKSEISIYDFNNIITNKDCSKDFLINIHNVKKNIDATFETLQLLFMTSTFLYNKYNYIQNNIISYFNKLYIIRNKKLSITENYFSYFIEKLLLGDVPWFVSNIHLYYVCENAFNFNATKHIHQSLKKNYKYTIKHKKIIKWFNNRHTYQIQTIELLILFIENTCYIRSKFYILLILYKYFIHIYHLSLHNMDKQSIFKNKSLVNTIAFKIEDFKNSLEFVLSDKLPNSFKQELINTFTKFENILKIINSHI